MKKKAIIGSILVVFFSLTIGANVFLLYENRRTQRKLASLANNIVAEDKRLDRLSKDFARLRWEFRYPTELQAREKLIDAWFTADFGTDIKSMKIAAESFPDNWETGISVVRYYDKKMWGIKAIPKTAYFLIAKTLGGILYSTWGAANIHTFKSYTEIKSFLPITSDGSTESVEIWRSSKLWQRTDIWDDVFWRSEDNFYKILEQKANEEGKP